MSRMHVVRQGEFLAVIAQRLGLAASAIWDDPDNADLRARRPNPDMLAPGDVLHIPDGDEPDPLPVTAQATNRYVAKVPRVKVCLHLNGADGPLVDEPYAVVGLPTPLDGRTDSQGKVEFEAPLGLREVRVILAQLDREHVVRIGDLDPLDEASGVRQRLEQLGYYGFALGEATRHPLPRRDDRDADALRAFQRDHGLAPNGIADGPTRDALRAAHRT